MGIGVQDTTRSTSGSVVGVTKSAQVVKSPMLEGAGWVSVEHWWHQPNRQVGGGTTITGVFETEFEAQAWCDWLYATQPSLQTAFPQELIKAVKRATP